MAQVMEPEIRRPPRAPGAWRRALWALFVLIVLVVGGVIGAALKNWNMLRTQAPPEMSASLPPGATVVVSPGEIDVEGGILPLSPLNGGLVKAIHVKEGEKVKAGDPLVEFDAALAEVNVTEAELGVELAKLKLAVAEQAARDHPWLVQQQSEAVKAAEAKAEALDKQIEKLKKQVDLKQTDESDLLGARALARGQASQILVEKSRLDQLKSTDPQLPVRAAKKEVERAEKQLDLAKKQRAYYTLTAPVGGTVLRLQARQGQVIGGYLKDPLVWFLPDDRPWIVRCEVEQQFANRIRVGMPCDVYDDRIESPSWKGSVKFLSPWVSERRFVGNDPLAWRDVRTVECVVALEKTNDEFRIGQRVRVIVREPK
jgi:multidrug resistance efflux pump